MSHLTFCCISRNVVKWGPRGVTFWHSGWASFPKYAWPHFPPRVGKQGADARILGSTQADARQAKSNAGYLPETGSVDMLPRQIFFAVNHGGAVSLGLFRQQFEPYINWAYELNMQPKWKLLTPFPSRNPCAIWISSFGITPNVMEFHPFAVGPTEKPWTCDMVNFTNVHVSFSVLTTFPTCCTIDFYVKISMCTLWSQFPLQTWFLHCSHWYTLLISMLISMIPHFILIYA